MDKIYGPNGSDVRIFSSFPKDKSFEEEKIDLLGRAIISSEPKERLKESKLDVISMPPPRESEGISEIFYDFFSECYEATINYFFSDKEE